MMSKKKFTVTFSVEAAPLDLVNMIAAYESAQTTVVPEKDESVQALSERVHDLEEMLREAREIIKNDGEGDVNVNLGSGTHMARRGYLATLDVWLREQCVVQGCDEPVCKRSKALCEEHYGEGA